MSAALINPHDPSAPCAYEVLAGQRLMPSLRLALHYVLAVGAQRYPRLLLPLHSYREEVTLALAALLEGHALASYNASFGEHFYNLRRVPAAGASTTEARDRRIALVLLLLPLYARTRIESVIESRFRPPDEEGTAAHGAAATGRRQLLLLLWRVGLAASDAACLAQLLSFLFGHSQYPSLQHRILGVLLQRAQPSASSLATASKPSTRGEWLRAALQLPLQHAQHLLLISVFGFRLLEHWHAPQHALAPRGVMVPPPPLGPPLPPGQSAWAPRNVCPVCRMAANDPTASPSGFVFCAQCIYPAVTRTGCCPATRQPVRLSELRRLYETSRSRPANM